jgi:protein TonB
MPNSPLNGMSMGNGRGSGLGGGNGSGLGPGSGGNYGGGVRQIGGGVSAPSLIYSVDPEFSEEARKAKFMGVVTVNLIVDQQGRPQNVRVTHGAGMGLDEKAIEAVKQYKFKPAMEAGKPVAVMMNVEVNFQIF